MTREAADLLEEREARRRQLNRLLIDLQELDSSRRRLQRFARFERQREIRKADRQNRAPRRTAREDELETEVSQIEATINRTVAEIGEIVSELGLEGVNLW